MNAHHYTEQIEDLIDAMSADSDVGAHELRDFLADLGRRCIASSVELANLGF